MSERFGTQQGTASRRLLAVNLLVSSLLGIAGWLPILLSTDQDDLRRPLFISKDRLGDLLSYWSKTFPMTGQSLAMPGQVFNYPAPGAWVMYFFLHATHSPRLLYRAVLSMAALVTLGLALRALSANKESRRWTVPNFLVLSVLGLPLIFAADRGNIEFVNWFFVVCGVALFTSERYLLAGILFGCAFSVKPFPILFFLLLAAKRKWKPIGAGLAVAFTLNIAALAALGPHIKGAYLSLQPGLRDYIRLFLESLRPEDEARFDHSLFGVVRRLLYIKFAPQGWRSPTLTYIALRGQGLPFYQRLDFWYNFFAGLAVLAVLVLIFWFRKKLLLNVLFAICIAVALLPFSAYEYTLLYLYIPLLFFLQYLSRSTVHPWRCTAILTCFSLLLMPTFTEFAAWNGCVQAALLIGLLVLVADYPMALAELDGTLATEEV